MFQTMDKLGIGTELAQGPIMSVLFCYVRIIYQEMPLSSTLSISLSLTLGATLGYIGAPLRLPRGSLRATLGLP